MELAALLADKIVGLALYILVGFLLIQTKCMNYEQSRALTVLTLYLLTPCAMLDAFQSEFLPEKLGGMGLCLLGGLLVMGLYALLTRILTRVFSLGPVEKTSLAYPNAGNFMIPLVASSLGTEWVIYLSPCFVLVSIMLFSHCQGSISGQYSFRISKLLKNVVIWAIIAGLILFVLGIRLPDHIGNTIHSLGTMMGPMCMITIGMTLGSSTPKQVFCNYRIWLLCFGRLILYPICAILLFRYCGIIKLHPQSKNLLTVVILAAGAPTAATLSQFAQLYRSRQDATLASSINLLSTLLSLAT